MNPIILLVIALGDLILGAVAWIYIRKFHKSTSIHTEELEKSDQELKKKVAELQALKDLSEKAGYSVESEKRKLSAMIGSLLDGIAMIDQNFNLIVANHAFYQILKIEETVDLFKIIASLSAKIDLEKILKQAFKTQKLIKTQPFEINGFFIEVNIEPVKDQYGYLLGMAIVFHDITTERNLEHLKEEFTAMMVHELRTPLTTISYSVNNMLIDSPKITKSELSANLNIIKDTTENMLGLVTELLDMTKLESGKFVIVKKDNDLGKMLEEKIELFKPLTDQKKIILELEIGDGLDHISFDPNRLGQVVNNLLSNAIKYTDIGKISIKASLSDDHVMVSITDSGEGVKKEDLPKLFSKFEQLGKGKTGEKIGTGLGLVIAKGIIEAHGGKIWAQSLGEGKGTTFSFSIPLKS